MSINDRDSSDKTEIKSDLLIWSWAQQESYNLELVAVSNPHPLNQFGSGGGGYLPLLALDALIINFSFRNIFAC